MTVGGGTGTDYVRQGVLQTRDSTSEISDIVRISLSEKIAAGLVGPICGLLPPSIQEKWGYQQACIMSTTSRITNATIGLTGLATLGLRQLGVDIDPTTSNYLTTMSLWILGDGFVREGIYAMKRAINIESMGPTEPWGEPFSSITYGLLTDK